MLKKTIPFILMSGLMLGACGVNNNGALPNNNETPMEDMDERERNWAPNLREDDRRGGTDIDGIDNGRNDNNGVDNGVINNDDQLNNDNDNMFRDDNAPLDEELDRRNNNDLNNR